MAETNYYDYIKKQIVVGTWVLILPNCTTVVVSICDSCENVNNNNIGNYRCKLV